MQHIYHSVDTFLKCFPKLGEGVLIKWDGSVIKWEGVLIKWEGLKISRYSMREDVMITTRRCDDMYEKMWWSLREDAKISHIFYRFASGRLKKWKWKKRKLSGEPTHHLLSVRIDMQIRWSGPLSVMLKFEAKDKCCKFEVEAWNWNLRFSIDSEAYS